MAKNHPYGNDYDMDIDEELSDYDSQESGPPPPPPPLPPGSSSANMGGGSANDQYAYDEYNMQSRSRSDFDYSIGGSSRPPTNSANAYNQNEIVQITGSPSKTDNSYKDVDTTQDMFFEEDQSVEIGPTKVVEDYVRRETDESEAHAAAQQEAAEAAAAVNDRSMNDDSNTEKGGRCGRGVYIGIVLCLTICLIVILGTGFGTGAFLSNSSNEAEAGVQEPQEGGEQPEEVTDGLFTGTDGSDNGGLFNNDGTTTTVEEAPAEVPVEDGLFPEDTGNEVAVPDVPVIVNPTETVTTPATIDVGGGERGVQMLDYVSSVAYNGRETFVDRSSPESLALDFLILEDPLQLDPTLEENHWRINQRFALLTLWYNSGPLWTNYTNWLLAVDECTWFGVGCITDETTGNNMVVVLNLEENNVYGRIPNDLALLSPSLVSLSLAGNRLEGVLPPSFQQMINLQELWLDRNLLSGNLESYDFSTLTSLSLLDISSNIFGGNLPTSLYSLSQLSFLVLDNNRFTGPISPLIGNMENLERFTASNNQLSGYLVPELGNLVNLQVLWLFNNTLSGPIPREVSNMISLSTFDVVNNRITGNIPTEFAALPGLAYLNLGVNNMTGPIPTQLPANLLILNIESNQLTGRLPSQTLQNLGLMSLRIGNNNFDLSESNNGIPPFIYGMNSLRELRMNGLGLQGVVQGELGQLENLVTLQLQDNQLSQAFPWENMIASCQFLQTLNLANNQFTGQAPADLPQLPSLRYVDMHNNRFAGLFPEQWAFDGAFANLQHLDIGMNRMGGQLPDLGGDDGNLAALTSLMIHTNEFTGQLPMWIGENLVSLQVLDIATNRFVGPFPQSLTTLRQLRVLNMHLNYFSSELPANLGDMGRSLQELRLHTNIVTDDPSFGFRGPIPTSIGQLISLRILELYTNLFTGTLPTEIGLLDNLVVLDVEYNPISGQVPAEYGAMTNLQEFYISNTDITGMIPTAICENPPAYLVTDCDVVCSCCTNCVE